MTQTTEPPATVIPPFVLPDRAGKPFNTARLRGRRHMVLLFVSPEDADVPAYLQTFAARQAELAWLHTDVIVVIPDHGSTAMLPPLPFPVLRDDGRVRTRVLPDVAPEVAALLVADHYGQVATWRTARRGGSLPDVDTALGWAWEVAQPKGSCGGVTWTPAAQPQPSATSPAPIGHFTVGTHRRTAYQHGQGSRLAVRGGSSSPNLEPRTVLLTA